MKTSYRAILSLIALPLAFGATQPQAAPFQIIGPTGAEVRAVSEDGTTIVGTASSIGFRWSEANGFQAIPGTREAVGVSADGSTIAVTVIDGGLEKAGVWTEATGVQLIDPVPDSAACDAFFGASYDVSDGAVVVGQAWVTACKTHAFRWDAGGGSVDLGTSVVGRSSTATGVSGDGQRVVGWQDAESGYRQGARWDGLTQTLFWDIAAGVDVMVGMARAATYDGSVVVGRGAADGGAWRWTGGDYVESIGALPGFSGNTFAWDISEDGGVIVGGGLLGPARDAFIWTEILGILKLDNYLVSIGVLDAVGLDLGLATGISADGTVIVGSGFTPSFEIFSWRIDLGDALSSAGPNSLERRFAIRSCSPNPFANSTEIAYSTTEARNLSIIVYDVSGRAVRSVLHGRIPAGDHAVVWDGRGDDGRSVAAGTYLVRVHDGARSQTQRVTLLR